MLCSAFPVLINMLQFAKEGYPFIIFFSAVTVLSAIIRWNWVTVVALILTIFMFYFFRDPDRTTEKNIENFISPADGKITPDQLNLFFKVNTSLTFLLRKIRRQFEEDSWRIAFDSESRIGC